MTRVFLIHKTDNFDRTAVQRFGEVVEIMQSREVGIGNVDGLTRLIAERLELHKYNPINDIIVMTGRSLLLAILVGVATAGGRSIRILVWSPGGPDGKGFYLHRVFTPQTVMVGGT